MYGTRNTLSAIDYTKFTTVKKNIIDEDLMFKDFHCDRIEVSFHQSQLILMEKNLNKKYTRTQVIQWNNKNT